MRDFLGEAEMNGKRLAGLILPRIFACIVVCPLFAGDVLAQTYPARTIRIVVGFPAGGSMDITARLLAEKLRAGLGQQVIVENRPGASGTIASDSVAKAPADGYTMMLGGGGSLAIKKKLDLRLPYDPDRDYAMVIHVANLPLLLVVPAALPAKSIGELVALAKKHPGELNFASSGVGSTGHLSSELFRVMAGIKITHIPYKGSSQIMPDLISGQISIAFDQITTAGPNVKAGKLKALGISTLKRSSLMPAVPAIAEMGVSGYESTSWNGIVVPIKTPHAIVERLQQETDRVLKTAEMRDKLVAVGAEAVGGSSAQFSTFVRSEAEKWGKLIDRLGIKPE